MESVRWLYDLQHFGVKLGLENIRALLGVLGHPERAYPSVIVAGTNGKGSVAAMLHAMLGAAGVRAGLFTSPHLVRPNERIRVADLDIDDDEFDRLLRRIRRRIEDGLTAGDIEVHPSFFEVITATALEAFRDNELGSAVLEVGLGGRLDATNAVASDLSVIVSIDLDHVKSLGPTVEQIAGEKAGVIKRGKPVVSGVVRQQAVEVVRRTCEARNAPLVDARLAVELVSEEGSTFTLETASCRYPDLRLSLPGRHQIDNARIALATFECFSGAVGVEPDPDSVRRALASVRWPGRLQWLSAEGDRPELLFDGAHNPAGVCALASYLRTLDRPAPIALFGAMHGKLLDRMFEPLSSVVRGLVVTRPGVQRAADPEDVAAEARRQGIDNVEVVAEPARALKRACALAGAGEFVLITGSLYLVGETLGQLHPSPTPGPVSM